MQGTEAARISKSTEVAGVTTLSDEQLITYLDRRRFCVTSLLGNHVYFASDRRSPMVRVLDAPTKLTSISWLLPRDSML
jgi:hypothetical protein